MNLRALSSVFPYAAIIVVAGLMGFSITRVDAGAAEHQVGFTLGGALVAGIAILISRLFSVRTQEVTAAIPEKKLLGVKVGVVSFCVALSGWLVAVLLNGKVGFVLVVAGVAAGFVGMAIHFASIFRSNE